MDWLEIKEFFKDSAKFIIFVLIVLILMIYVVSILQVVGNSMYPTLKNREMLVIDKLKYRYSDIKREDIISLKYADTKYLIKRVIGLPGDKISIKDNVLYINEKEYKESYIPEHLEYDDFYLSDLNYEVIPDDMYLVLGDNRVDSLDSRKIGLIKKDDIIGKVFIRFWPLNKIRFF